MCFKHNDQDANIIACSRLQLCAVMRSAFSETAWPIEFGTLTSTSVLLITYVKSFRTLSRKSIKLTFQCIQMVYKYFNLVGCCPAI